MITPESVQNALAVENLPALRAAFDGFLAFPDEPPLDGFADVPAIVASFDAVIGVLRHDFEVMPEATLDRMSRCSAEGHGGLIGVRYSDGAQAAIRAIMYFAERFAGKHAFA
ncbi:hypothetical protein [Lichenifustis flavocetrariae]|uniref:Uncharacterized protein n=1 Tax=Lichenifustis flavocetrariae TaxID=2949735 RepID=A0AA42CS46_9HYPH|nr:hypothetical protein [Lichenifustis flavocetrariae]MCW6513157.1 hypothetical protein [Lichenifustis flavocetrariae]